MSGYYQYCNRIAVLNFLNANNVRAHLLFVYFLGDMGDSKRRCPKNEKGWEPELKEQDLHVGLPARHRLSDKIHALFLEVCPRQD